MQCACTSTVLIRLPAITTSQRLACACACPVWPEPPPELAPAPAEISQPVKTRPADASVLIGMGFLPDWMARRWVGTYSGLTLPAKPNLLSADTSARALRAGPRQ